MQHKRTVVVKLNKQIILLVVPQWTNSEWSDSRGVSEFKPEIFGLQIKISDQQVIADPEIWSHGINSSII